MHSIKKVFLLLTMTNIKKSNFFLFLLLGCKLNILAYDSYS